MPTTVADVVALDVLQRGEPRVVAGAGSLGRAVRWVHVAEITDIAALLQGGELILTTGLVLPDDPDGLRAYVDELADVGVAGLVVELGRRFRRVPDALVRAAERRAVPLIVLHQPIPFVTVTEAVHNRLVASGVDELRASEHLHRVFTELSVEGAEPAAIVSAVATSVGAPVVLENLAHQAVVVDRLDTDAADLLMDWESRSRALVVTGRSGIDPATGWAVAVVGARGEDWGRLVATLPTGPAPHTLMALERGAVTLALARLAQRDGDSVERQAQRSVLGRLLEHDYASPREIAARARALGVPLEARMLVAAVILRCDTPGDASGDSPGDARSLRWACDRVEEAARSCGVPALVATLPGGDVGTLVSVAARDRVPDVLQRLAAAVRQRLGGEQPQPVLAVGSVVAAVADVRRSLREAQQVAAARPVGVAGRGWVGLGDIRLRGLVHLLRDDVRMQRFAERELGALLPHPDLVTALEAYLANGRNVSAAATATYLSRPSFYDRLRRIEGVLGVDLDDVETCLSLHVALLAMDAVRGNAVRGDAVRPQRDAGHRVG